MKKILMIIDSLGSGGAQRQFVHLAIGLKEAGHAVLVFYYHPHEFFLEKLVEAGVEARLIRSSGAISRIIRFYSEIRRVNPDTVISFLDTPNLITCIAKLLGAGGFSLIVSERCTDVGRLYFRRRLVVSLYRFADAVVPNSRTQTESLSRYLWLKNKLHWIPNCVDLNRFKPINKPALAGAKTLNLVIVGRFEPQKNAKLIAEWAARFGCEDTRFHFDWYGNQLLDVYPTAEQGNSYLQALAIAGHSTSFKMSPPRKDIDCIYRSADAFCLPSFYEGTPNVICEAMASGLPILCSNVCDNPYIVQDGVNGFLFDPNKLETLVVCLEKLAALGPAGRREMGLLNRARAKDLFSEDKYISTWGQLV